MRLFFIIDETPFYHPQLVEDLLRLSRPEDVWAGAAVIPRASRSNDLETFFRRNWRQLWPSEITRLAVRKYGAAAREGFLSGKLSLRPVSVASVLRQNDIPIVEVDGNLNAPDCVSEIRAFHPDVVICSTSSILEAELLGSASRCCLNRHASLLPAYRGRLPVLHALAAGESEVGVSIHLMTPAVDQGAVLAQGRVSVAEGDTLTALYGKCFEISAPLILESLDKVRWDDFTAVASDKQPSYFGLPTAETFKRFRENGGRLV